ncbi:MAG TPA: MBL fold metallo-hydrolase [Streptosporangiaceae bacterium]|nr:MBL fold metallo-hydrolase [Streptosporangiaceae bacterium]
MRLTVLGGCGAWPEAGQACSGFLVEQDGFRLLLEAGYATLPRLLGLVSAAQVDAVFISHGHPDHCADLNPLLRARALGGAPVAPLPVFAPPGALDAVLALDRPGMLAGACTVTEFRPGDRLGIGPFRAETRLLPHWLPNAGLRLVGGGRALAYTGDSGDGAGITALAERADLLLAEATYVDQVPAADQPFLSCARQAGQQAAQAGVARLMLTHLWPGTDPRAAQAAAAAGYGGGISVAVAGLATGV